MDVAQYSNGDRLVRDDFDARSLVYMERVLSPFCVRDRVIFYGDFDMRGFIVVVKSSTCDSHERRGDYLARTMRGTFVIFL